MISKKRISTAPAVIAVIITLISSILTYPASAGAAPNASFHDVIEGYWAEKQILSLANYGIVSGGADGRFRPTEGLRRSELAKLLIKAFALTQNGDSPTFTDIPSNHWAVSYISTAASQGLVGGYPDGRFGPDEFATRAQVAKILVTIKGYPTSGVTTKTFSDIPDGYWGYPYIETAAKNYLISGYSDGTFRPNAQVTRAEAAALIYRALKDKDYLIEKSTVNQIAYERYRRFLDAGPLSINVLKVPKAAPLSITPALAKDKVTGTEKLSSMAQRKGAAAGINADFFSSKSGECSGLMVNGQVMSSPISSRSYFGILPDKTCYIDRAAMKSLVTVETTSGVEKSGNVSWVNKTRDGYTDTIIAYTPFYGATTLTNNDGTEVIVKLSGGSITPGGTLTGTVVNVRYDAGNSPIQTDEIVLSGVGSGKTFLNSTMKTGGTVKLTFAFEPAWKPGASAVGGGPRLVRSGQAAVESEGGFSSSLITGRHARTGIGIDSQGNLVILVVDGKMDYFSIGMTLAELAADLKNRGAVDAMNLDGGGSSTLYFNGAIRNYPNGGNGERSISNSILFVPN